MKRYSAWISKGGFYDYIGEVYANNMRDARAKVSRKIKVEESWE